MRKITVLLLAIAAAFPAACDNTPKTSNTVQTVAAPESVSPVKSPASGSVGEEMPVYAVASVVLSRPDGGTDGNVVIRATGTAHGSGWTEAKLEPLESGDGDTLSYRL